MITNIIVNLQIEGLHNWPDAKKVFPEVGFLSSMHRHNWFIKLKKEVTHSDRDIEFIIFKRNVLDYLKQKYYNVDSRTHEFGSKSCEMLAEELLTQFECNYVSVMEDNECGAEVLK